MTNETESKKRKWKCPNCKHTERRHHNEKKRPFCDKCEFRDAVLIEMKPIGKGSGKFYDGDGNAINIE